MPLLAALAFTGSVVVGCGDPDTSFINGEPSGTDPYCNAIEDWAEEVTLSAVYSDSKSADQIEVGIEVRQDPVIVDGQVAADGAEISLILYDKPDLWLVLLPYDDSDRVTVDGMVRCRNREARYRLTLGLDSDSNDIETDISFSEGDLDGGVVEDAGDAD